MVDLPVLPRLGGWADSTGCAAALAGASDRQPPVLVVTACDHAVAEPVDGAESPISDLPWGYAQHTAEQIISGASPLNDTARLAGCDVAVVTVSAAEGDNGDEGAPPSIEQWLATGQQAADEHADAGIPLLLTGTVGAGATTTSAALVGVLCNVEPVNLVGRGARVGARHGISDEKWNNKTLAVRDLMFPARRHRRGPASEEKARAVLELLGSPDIAYLTGLLSQAAVRRTPVVLDGVATFAAGLLAEAMTPGASRWWLAPHHPTEPAAATALRNLSLVPVVGEDLGAPDAGAGLAVLPMLTAAVLATGGH